MSALKYDALIVSTKTIFKDGRKFVRTAKKVRTFEIKAQKLPTQEGDAILKRKGNEIAVAIEGGFTFWANKTKYIKALSQLYARQQLQQNDIRDKDTRSKANGNRRKRSPTLH